MTSGPKVEIEGTASYSPMKSKPARAKADSPGVSEEEFVRETLSAQTGITFEVIAPHPAFPLPVDSLDWFMRCRIKDQIAAAPYLNAAWKEKGGPIWLESLAVGDTLDWIELAYGADQAETSLNTDYSRFDQASFQADFNQRYPIVARRVREYEEGVAKVAKKTKMHLELRHAGSRGLLVFTVAARVEMRATTRPALEDALRKNIEALREAYYSIEKLEG